ncbi:MAG: hypothetical protein Q7T16_02015 [Candidatus Burarchaeum sp.]|nr:hypothetical protein [Candidatus Burarchaeum sp.]MDO8339409.1 hypothetical protein [Candidatus Burarchaeum sp.]
MYEKSILVGCLGDTPYVRVLDYFISNHIFDCSVQDMAEYTELARNTVKNIVDELLDADLVVKTRNVGRAVMYKLNLQNPEVKLLLEFDMKMSKLKSDEAEDGARHKAMAARVR